MNKIIDRPTLASSKVVCPRSILELSQAKAFLAAVSIGDKKLFLHVLQMDVTATVTFSKPLTSLQFRNKYNLSIYASLRHSKIEGAIKIATS